MIRIRRKTKYENRFHPKMGRIKCKVTKIQKILLGIIPLKTLHHYRETYYGKVKDVDTCKLSN